MLTANRSAGVALKCEFEQTRLVFGDETCHGFRGPKQGTFFTGVSVMVVEHIALLVHTTTPLKDCTLNLTLQHMDIFSIPRAKSFTKINRF